MKIAQYLSRLPLAAQVFSAALAVAFIRLIYIHFTALDLAPDEAHYWDWSRHLQLSYYSKPPLVAWLMALSTSVFGHTPLGVRFFSVVGLAVVSLVAFYIANRWKGKGAGWLAFALMLLTPELSAGGLLMTPDIPCLTFWALSLYMVTKIDWEDIATQNNLAVWKSPFSKTEKGVWQQFVCLGILVGLAGLSKYTAAVFFPLLGLYLLVSKERRRVLLAPYLYVSGFVALLVTTPVFIWNYTHDFVGLFHVLGQGKVEGVNVWHKTLSNFLGGQLGVVGPVLFFFLIASFFAYKKFKVESEKEKVSVQGAQGYTPRIGEILWWFSAPLFAFFLYKSLGSKVQPNWPVLSIYTGLILLAGYASTFKAKWVKVVFVLGLALSLLITIVAHDTFILRLNDGWFAKVTGIYIKTNKDPLKPVFGWRGLGHGVSAVASRVEGEKVYLTTRYQTAAELGFYIEGNPDVLYFNPGYRRQNQMDYWPWPENMADKTVIYVREGGEIEDEVLAGFKSCILLQKIVARRWNFKLREASVYACAGYIGLDRIKPERY